MTDDEQKDWDEIIEEKDPNTFDLKYTITANTEGLTESLPELKELDAVLESITEKIEKLNSLGIFVGSSALCESCRHDPQKPTE